MTIPLLTDFLDTYTHAGVWLQRSVGEQELSVNPNVEIRHHRYKEQMALNGGTRSGICITQSITIHHQHLLCLFVLNHTLQI